MSGETPSELLEIDRPEGKPMDVGKWTLPEDKVLGYLRLLRATENSSQRYNYAFDSQRESAHEKLLEAAGIGRHELRECAEFDRELRKLCDELYPLPDNDSKPCKLTTPPRGIMS